MNIDQVVVELIQRVRDDRSLTHDKAALRRALAEYSEHTPVAIAQRAHRMFREFMSHKDAEDAQGAALVANVVFLSAGQEEPSLRAAYDFCQVRFMLANDFDAYGSIRAQFAGLYTRAKELGINDLVFRAATSMADCTYFAAESEGTRRDAILNMLIDDLLIVCDATLGLSERPDIKSKDFARFVSLVANAYALTEERQLAWPAPCFVADEASATDFAARMKRLASAVEELVPENFTFEALGGPDKSADIAAKLAALSSKSGSKAKARARLRASLSDD
jgi:hypothetical protein